MRRITLTLAVLAALAGEAFAQITVTAPAAGTTTVGPADDYASRAFQDPWDMNEHSDLGWLTFGTDQPAVNLSGITVSGGVFTATPTSNDPNFWLLDTWIPGSALLGKIGKRFPIDAAKYRVLVLRMRLSERPSGDQAMQILWSNNTIYGSEPGGGFRVSNSVLTYDGWNYYVIDLATLGSAVGPGWSGNVDSLRLDPTQYQVGQIQLDFARLVPLDAANLQRTIQWTGAASVDIFLDNDANAANGTLGQIARSASGGSFPFYVGGIAPGDYYVAMRQAGTANALVYSPGIYRVLALPTLVLTSPSEEGSSDDFATVQLGNPWDMNATSDVDRATGLTGLATGAVAGVNEAGQSLGSVGVLQATSTAAAGVGDPALYWMWSTLRGQNYRIDTDRYRVLTFELNLPGARNVLQGSIARVVWKIAEESAENVSQDIVINHRAGASVFAKVIADMETLELETDPGGSPSTTGWADGGGANPGVDNFRIDPHEFAPATAFAFRRVKLAAFERAGASYTFSWSFSNPSSLATTLKLVADLDRQGCDGITIATGLNPASGSYAWTVPVGFANGEARWVCAQVLSGATVVNQTYSRWPIVREVGYTGLLPRLVPDRTTLRFGAVKSGATLTAVTPAQAVVVTQIGAGSTSWSVSSNQSWVSVSPTSLSGTSVFDVGIVNPGVLPPTGLLRATLTISGTGISNSPQYVDVFLDVKAPGTTAAPFGAFETPANGTTGVTGAIPVTGWALDDVGVSKVEIYRNALAGEPTAPNGRVYIGDANLVAGARPDVEAVYRDTYPRAHLAGWGYMLLTNFLPNGAAGTVGGNGTFTLYAYAVDFDGKTTLLGSKTITCSNATAVKPFGTIDTPSQGGTASGSGFPNFGWVLTPQPGVVPFDGSTINVFVDGAPVGGPTAYGLARSDIDTLFPGYANTGRAVGYRVLDTTALANGVHTLAWSATDNLGRSDGIGSRYFQVVNGAGDLLANGSTVGFSDLGQIYGEDLGRPARDLASLETAPPLRLELAARGSLRTRVPSGNGGRRAAYLVGADRLERLPVGAGFDPTTGELRWQPGEGFAGRYRLVVIERDDDGRSRVQPVEVETRPAGEGAR
jgi:hypothetical protein